MQMQLNVKVISVLYYLLTVFQFNYHVFLFFGFFFFGGGGGVIGLSVAA